MVSLSRTRALVAILVVFALAAAPAAAFSAPSTASAMFRSKAMHKATSALHNHRLPLRQVALRGGGRAAGPVMSTATGVGAKLTPATAAKIIDSVDVFIFDCDGVIWRGDSLIEGVPEILDQLRAAGKKLFFVTNNSTKSRKGYKSKFDSLGLDVKPEEIFSSSFAAAAYFEQTKFKETGKKVYIIGEVGIQEELDLVGVPWIGGENDKDMKIQLKSGFALPHDHDVGAVVVGFDRHINYYKIQYAQLCINENPGCKFIATNLDAVTHLTDAQEWAGNGSMAGAIKGCTGQDPIVVGKPSPLMIDYLCTKYSLKPDKICMVGDRLDTDIVFGNSNGCKSILVLSGVTSEDKYQAQAAKPNGVIASGFADAISSFY